MWSRAIRECAVKNKVSVGNAEVVLDLTVRPDSLMPSIAGIKGLGVMLLLHNTDLCMVMLNS